MAIKKRIADPAEAMWQCKKPKLTLGTTSARFNMELVTNKRQGMQSVLPRLLPASVKAGDMLYKQLTVGCDFAGIGGPAIALAMLGVDFEVLWCSDIDIACRNTLAYHFSHDDSRPRIFGDVGDVVVSQLPPVDIYPPPPPMPELQHSWQARGP